MTTTKQKPKTGEIVIRRLCVHGETEGHRFIDSKSVTAVSCPGPPKIRLTDADLAAAFFDVLTDKEPHLHPDLAGPKTRQLIELLFNPHA